MTTIDHIVLAIVKSECRPIFEKDVFTESEWNFMQTYMSSFREKNMSIQRMEVGGIVLIWDSTMDWKPTIACKISKTGIEFSKPHIYDRKKLLLERPLEIKFRKPNPRYLPLIEEIREIKEIMKRYFPGSEALFV